AAECTEDTEQRDAEFRRGHAEVRRGNVASGDGEPPFQSAGAGRNGRPTERDVDPQEHTAGDHVPRVPADPRPVRRAKRGPADATGGDIFRRSHASRVTGIPFVTGNIAALPQHGNPFTYLVR